MSDLHPDLTRMLDQYDERRRIEREAEGDDARFLARFAELRRDVVWPVLEEAGTLLTLRGHGVAIEEQEFAVDADGRAREAGISLRIAPAGMPARLHAGDHGRSLSITTRHASKTVWISAGRPFESGEIASAKGAYPLKRVNRRLVEAKVVKFVAALMNG